MPRPAAHRFIGSNPDAAVPALDESADEVIHQPRFGGVVKQSLSHLAIHALTFGSDPQRALAVTKDIADSDPVHTGKPVGRGFTLLEAEEIRCRNPDFSIAIFIHSL